MSSARGKARILFVDDIPPFLEEMRALLEPHYRVTTSPSPLKAAELACGKRFDVILTTLVMRECDGFQLIRRIRGAGVSTPIILITRFGNANTAVEALRIGANDYLAKPVEPAELLARIRRALEGEAMPPGQEAEPFLTQDAATLRLLEEAGQAATSAVRVLITGETGTGKELIARRIHRLSPWGAGPFIAVNCAAIPQELMESEFFGHEAGAFTGAQRRRPGRLEMAAGGTLFLDEVAELPILMQSKLLRVLQGGDFQRVGGSETLAFNARVVCATNRNLATEVREGRFREDLYFRLRVIELSLPALRARGGDIRLLARHFLRRFGQQATRPDAALWRWMEAHSWPGNARELEHFIERLCVLHPGKSAGVHHLPDDQRTPTLPAPAPELDARLPYSEALAAFRQAYFQRVLAEEGGHLSRAARRAGMDKGQFHRTITRLGLR